MSNLTLNREQSWGDLPYFPISQYYKAFFGQKVYKVPVSVAQSCPNRDGLKGMTVCNFCDEWGSAAFPEFRHMELQNQIETTKARIARRFKVKKFLVYFQAYTNTFAKTDLLRRQFEVAVKFEDVLGFVVGTRPDCISDAVIDLWNEYCDKGNFLSVELGVQSFNNSHLEWMSRGHTAEQSYRAIEKIAKKSPQVNLGIHLMFGLPGETEEEIIEAAKICSRLPIHNVKIHNLHVLKNTPLEQEYKRGEFTPIDRESYTDRTIVFLQHLNPDISVHRLAAVASRHDELVAPEWAKSKLDTYQRIIDEMKARKATQGQFYKKQD